MGAGAGTRATDAVCQLAASRAPSLAGGRVAANHARATPRSRALRPAALTAAPPPLHVPLAYLACSPTPRTAACVILGRYHTASEHSSIPMACSDLRADRDMEGLTYSVSDILVSDPDLPSMVGGRARGTHTLAHARWWRWWRVTCRAGKASCGARAVWCPPACARTPLPSVAHRMHAQLWHSDARTRATGHAPRPDLPAARSPGPLPWHRPLGP